MNKREKVRYEQMLADYLEKNKVQDTFHYLFRQLLLKKPKDPLSFLIKELRQKRKMRLIFVSGYAKGSVSKIAEQLSMNMTFNKISYFDDIMKKQIEDKTFCGQALKDNNLDMNTLDNGMFEAVVKAIKETPSHYKGVVLEGFPNNLTQLLYLTKRSLIPERFFYINYDEQSECKEAESFLKSHSDIVSDDLSQMGDYLSRHRNVSQIMVKQMKGGFKNMVTDIEGQNRKVDQIVQEVQTILNPKERAVTPLRPPQVVVLSVTSTFLTYPYFNFQGNISGPIITDIAKKYGIIKIATQDLITKEIIRKSVIGHYCHSARQNGTMIPDEVCCVLNQSEIRKTHSQHLGWVMDGFPMTIKQLNKFISWRCPPQIIVILNASPEYLKKRSELLKYDPETQKVYDLTKTKVDDEALLSKLKILPGHSDEQLQSRQKVFSGMIEQMKNKFSYRMSEFDMEINIASNQHPKYPQTYSLIDN